MARGLPYGVVLAGGRSRRYGRDKGALRTGSRSWAEVAAELLASRCREVWVSLRPEQTNPAPQFPRWDDPKPGRGPLAAIEAALLRADGDLLVLACDYPQMDGRLLDALLTVDGTKLASSAAPRAQVVIPVDAEGRDHPLVGLWRRSARPAVGSAIAAGELAVRDGLAHLSVTRLHAEGRSWWEPALRNVNRPEERT